MSERDTRIGIMNAEKVEWPVVTISGQPYTRKRQVSTITLAPGYFAVKDMYPSANEPALILELEAIVKDMTAPKAPKVVKGNDNG